MAETICAVFVYGTLKRGGCREKCWPRAPQSVEPATIRGRLHDLGPYPALVPGDDVVRGELWRLAEGDMNETLRVLDDVEGYHQLGDDYYRRIAVSCRTGDGGTVDAYAYEFVQPAAIADKPVVSANAHGECEWGEGGMMNDE